MEKDLVIVESPSKARAIQSYLGPQYKIMASVGHVKDLPEKRLGVDIKKGFRPEYEVIKGKEKVLKELKLAGEKARNIYLASDPDREGEAIAWHIAEELDGKKNIYRVLFNEITKKVVEEAIKNPTTLDRARYESQQARRILDRLVGYMISPLLWEKVKGAPSAGRVQSVALRMICDREREIYSFKSEEYWSLTALLEKEASGQFEAKLHKFKGSKLTRPDSELIEEAFENAKDKDFRVVSVESKKVKKSPPPPFITSTLQQEAHRKLGFSPKKTMTLAQQLYEGIDLGEKGIVGLITYMRTDSTRIASEAVSLARDLIGSLFGKEYLPTRPPTYKQKGITQDAHEAIRPTHLEFSPDLLEPYLTKDQTRLYSLIYKRFLASQMSSAVFNQTVVDIEAGDCVFRATGSVMLFDGFMTLYKEAQEEEEKILPQLFQGDLLKVLELRKSQHFTQPPSRYTEATLIKALEENGIGRPSTYATIVSNIMERGYVVKEKKFLRPTEIGLMVSDLLVRSFPNIMDLKFTANMEQELDKIENGEIHWVKVVEEFFKAFSKDLKKAQKDMKAEIPTEVSCPKCGANMVIKSGKNGLFLSCSNYPQCKETANFTRDEQGKIILDNLQDETSQETCPACGKNMVIKKGPFGRFLACSGYPLCKITRPIKSPGEQEVLANKKCPKCGKSLVIRTNQKRRQRYLACEGYPACDHTEPLDTGIPCPKEGCDGKVVERRSKKGKRFYSCSNYPHCDFISWTKPKGE